MNLGGILKVVQGWVKIKGATDGTKIGNVGDRLKVTGTTISPYPANQLFYEDMNATTGGVARNTVLTATFQNIYSDTGSGSLLGFRANFETTLGFYVRVVIDGTIYPFFGSTGLFVPDMVGNSTYDLSDAAVTGRPFAGLASHDNTVTLDVPHGIAYSTSIEIQARVTTANKQFKMGYVKILKES